MGGPWGTRCLPDDADEGYDGADVELDLLLEEPFDYHRHCGEKRGEEHMGGGCGKERAGGGGESE